MGGQTKKEWPWPLPFPEASCGDVGLLAALLGGAHAPGTDMNAHQLVADQEALSLHIGTKVTVGPPLRVADIMSETLRLSANVTLASHDWLHFCVQNEIGPGGRGRHKTGRWKASAITQYMTDSSVPANKSNLTFCPVERRTLVRPNVPFV